MKQPIVRIPQNIIELREVMASMLLSAPKSPDDTGYFPYKNLDYAFRQLHAGLDFNRSKLGGPRYEQLKRMADEMRPPFEADPDEKSGQARQGCEIIPAMEDILREAKRKA
jgi:hypothetical protein